MPAPTIVASYSTSYTAAGTSKDVTISCEAGDAIIVYALGEKSTVTSAPSATGITFAEYFNSNGDATYGMAGMYYALFQPARANVVVTITESSGSRLWGFTCLVLRGCRAMRSTVHGISVATGTGAPLLNVTTSHDNTAFICINVDASAQDGSSRAWRTINGVTPTSGNGLELTYAYAAGIYTSYAAYYDTHLEPPLSQATGLSAPTGQTYKIITLTVVGFETPTYHRTINVAYSGATTTISSSNSTFTVNEQNRFVIVAASVGVQPANGTDTNITTTMTYDALPMTSLGKVHSNNGAQGFVEIFYMVAPPIGSSRTVTLTTSATADLRMCGVLLYNVDQANPISSLQTGYGSSTSASLAFSPLLSRTAVFGATVSGTNISAYANGSPTGSRLFGNMQNFNNSSDAGCASAQLIVRPLGSQTVGWTLATGPWAAMAVAINPTSYFPIGAIYGFSA